MQASRRQNSRSASRSLSWSTEDFFSAATPGWRNQAEEDEEALKWAAPEKLPTYDRLRKTVLKSFLENGNGGNNKVVHKKIDVRKLDINDKQEFIGRIFKVTEEDNEKFLKKLRNHIDKTFEGACWEGKSAGIYPEAMLDLLM